MAWNEPGGNDKDPWGGRRGNNDGPPDLDEALKKFQQKLGGIFGGGGGKSSGSGKSGGGFSGGVLALIVVVALFFYGWAGIYQLDEQERGVVLRLGKFHDIMQPGLQWRPPIIDNVEVVNATKLRNYTAQGRMLTEDLNIVEVQLSVQYNIADVQSFVLKVRDPEMSLQHAVDSALRHVVGSSEMDDVLTVGRGVVSAEVQDRLQDYLNLYKTGINIEKVNMEDSSPPIEVKAAFDDVNKAREDEERYKNEATAYANSVVPVARGNAQRTIAEATAYRDEVVARAEGQAERFEQLLAEYKKAPKVTRERLYLDTMQKVMENSSKVMVDVEGGNNMMYLPLDKLMQQTASTTRDGRTSTQVDLSQEDRQELVRRVIDELERNSSSTSTRTGR